MRASLAILFIAMSLHGLASNKAMDSIVRAVDKSLENKEYYETRKLKAINKLYNSMGRARDDQALYTINARLYGEYGSYKYDSAYVYANKCLRLASEIGNPDDEVQARCDIIFCLLSAGLYKEAFDELHVINLKGCTNAYKKTFYHTASRLYYDISDYNSVRPYQHDYVRQGNLYTDSLLTFLTPRSAEWWYAVGMRQMKNRQYAACLRSFNTWLTLPGTSVHDKAVVTSCVGWVYESLNNKGQAIKYLAQAAIYDNESATKETTALRVLAGYLYREGDVDRAMRYVQASLDDANFYGARQRKIEIGNILPIIEQGRFSIVKSQRDTMAIAVTVAIALVLVLLVGTIFIRKQMRKLQMARHAIAESNENLRQSNAKLQEISRIKDEYIGKSFYLNMEHINKLEKLYRSIDRKIVARQYEDLRSSLKESTINAERKYMFADFDETFLKLFPRFVDQYNALFEPNAGAAPDAGSLTTEMRIFALIRLGITDSEHIANFLDYSVHTINTYKTRVKNKSVVENELFEQRIMEIQ